jgi:hypothetical protein
MLWHPNIKSGRKMIVLKSNHEQRHKRAPERSDPVTLPPSLDPHHQHDQTREHKSGYAITIWQIQLIGCAGRARARCLIIPVFRIHSRCSQTSRGGWYSIIRPRCHGSRLRGAIASASRSPRRSQPDGWGRKRKQKD